MKVRNGLAWIMYSFERPVFDLDELDEGKSCHVLNNGTIMTRLTVFFHELTREANSKARFCLRAAVIALLYKRFLDSPPEAFRIDHMKDLLPVLTNCDCRWGL